jgi:N-ethylmaleimide reductase
MKNASLFGGFQLGATHLSHRVVMAPLTRLRSDQDGDVPNAMMLEYYSQRASKGGLIISEATTVAKNGRGYLGAPGIYSDAQVEGWRRITDAVHAKGGHIFLQIWHVGRVSHVDLSDGATPVAPSEVPFEGAAFTANGWVTPSPSRALETLEIAGIIEIFRSAALRAKAAGFDGVEVHSANGYLLDQFLHDGSNKRTDQYGGSIENRARLLLEVTEAVTSVWGGDRVGVRLSPSGKFLDMSDSDPHALFDYVARALNRFGLAYLHIVEPRVNGSELVTEGQGAVASARLREIFTGPLISAGGFEAADATTAIADGETDLVAFGRHFIANPDLPHRLKHGWPLNAYDRSTFYGGDHRGYTDYPEYQEAS